MKTIFVAGHNGMVGSAICRELQKNETNVILTSSKSDLNLTNQSQVRAFFDRTRPDEVYMAAAKVGGIYANETYPADFIYENLMIQSNVIHTAFEFDVSKLLFLGSSCIYPKMAPQPITEEQLLGGKLEPTNEPYALAKIAGVKMCDSYRRQYGADFRSLMPTNLYGPGDNYHPDNSHVIPSLIRRIHEAKVSHLPEVVIWGTGRPLREFLHVQDLARACVFALSLSTETWSSATHSMLGHLNVGSEEEISIFDLSRLIADIIGYTGVLRFDPEKPDGAPRKIMNSRRLKNLGWKLEIPLDQGLRSTYQDFERNQSKV